MDRADLLPRLERIGLPFAQIARPEDLFDDPQLAAGGLVEVTLPSGDKTRLPALPLTFEGERMPLRRDLASVAEG